mgnify:CR=1
MTGDNFMERVEAAGQAFHGIVPPRPNLTDAEKAVINHLAGAWNTWMLLDNNHPDDNFDFRQAIHRLQDLVASRVARRVDPDFWWKPKVEQATPAMEV